MLCPLSTLAELAACELQSEDFSRLHIDTSCDAAVSSTHQSALPKKRRRKTGDNYPHTTGDELCLSVNYKSFFSSSFKPFKMKTKKQKPPFPVILMAIMSAPQNERFISFLSDNQSFIIIDPFALTKDVLPIHFEDCVPSFEQFVDILATWGFCVGNADPQYPNAPVYRHELFRRGEWENCLQMVMPSAREISINRLQYRDVFQALGENSHEDRKQPESVHFDDKKTRIVSPLEKLPDAGTFYPQDLYTNGEYPSVFSNPDTHLSSFHFTTTIGSNITGEQTSPTKQAEIVSAAMAALDHQSLRKTQSHRVRRHTIDSSQLDVITEAFLERSMARRLQSRRKSGLLGSNLGMTSLFVRSNSCGNDKDGK